MVQLALIRVSQLLQRLPARSVPRQLGQLHHPKDHWRYVPASALQKTSNARPVGMHVDDLLNAREKINKAVLTDMMFFKDQWGVEVISYEGQLHSISSNTIAPHGIHVFLAVQNIVVNTQLAKAMHAQSGAEREKRARIIESEGERTSIQNYSEGEIVCSE